MGPENKTKQKKKKKKQNKRNHISRALLGTKFNCTEAETIPLFYLKFILAKSWARLNLLIRLHLLWKYAVL